MTTERREQRWCLCGWSIFGNDLERRNAFQLHWASRAHKKRLQTEGRTVGVEIVVSKKSPE